MEILNAMPRCHPVISRLLLTERRYCCATFDSWQKASAKARTLLRCAKCKLSYYSSRESQRTHWKIHKRTCRQGVYDTSALGIQQCVEIVTASLQDPRLMDNQTVAVIQRLRSLLASTDPHDNTDPEAEAAFHVDKPGVPGLWAVFHASMRVGFGEVKQRQFYLDTLWAAPGMADFLLNDLLTDDLSNFRATDMDYCHYSIPYMIYAVLVRTCVETHWVGNLGPGDVESDPMGCHLGTGVLCHNAVAQGCSARFEACAARAMDLWYDEGVRLRCGQALCAAPSLAHTLLQQTMYTMPAFPEGENAQAHELIPTATDPDEVAELCSALHVFPFQLISACLDELCRNGRSCWDARSSQMNTTGAANYAKAMLGIGTPARHDGTSRSRFFNLQALLLRLALSDTSALPYRRLLGEHMALPAAASAIKLTQAAHSTCSPRPWIPFPLQAHADIRGSVLSLLQLVIDMLPNNQARLRSWHLAALTDGSKALNGALAWQPGISAFFAWLKTQAIMQAFLPLCLVNKASAPRQDAWSDERDELPLWRRFVTNRWPVLSHWLPQQQSIIHAIGLFAADPGGIDISREWDRWKRPITGQIQPGTPGFIPLPIVGHVLKMVLSPEQIACASGRGGRGQNKN